MTKKGFNNGRIDPRTLRNGGGTIIILLKLLYIHT